MRTTRTLALAAGLVTARGAAAQEALFAGNGPQGIRAVKLVVDAPDPGELNGLTLADFRAAMARTITSGQCGLELSDAPTAPLLALRVSGLMNYATNDARLGPVGAVVLMAMRGAPVAAPTSNQQAVPGLALYWYADRGFVFSNAESRNLLGLVQTLTLRFCNDANRSRSGR